MKLKLSRALGGWIVLFVAGGALLLAAPVAVAHCAGNHTGNHPHCSGDGGDSGDSIPLDCTVVDQVDPLTGAVLSDGEGVYADGIRKVLCSTGGTTQPNLSGIAMNSVAQGPVKKADRKIDLAFLGGCLAGNDCGDAPAVPGEFFTAGTLEDAGIGVRPYPEQDHIQNLAPGLSYEMAARIFPSGYAERWSFQLMGRVMPSEFHQGVWCDLEQNPNFDPDDAISQDTTVYIWDDGTGYTVTTGTITGPGSPPAVSPGTRVATLCSNAGPVECGGPSNSDLCNLRGQVAVQFTLHAAHQ